MANRKVLVLDGEKVHTLDIVRALGRFGLHVAVGSKSPDAISFRSRYASAVEVYPDPQDGQEPFVDWLERWLQQHPVDLVVPVTDLTVLPISANLRRLATYTRLATETPERVAITHDKRRTLELASRLGIPCPESRMISDVSELPQVVTALNYPVVGKPVVSSVWHRTGFRSPAVFYAFDAEHLVRQAERELEIGPLLLQEYVPGRGIGIEVLARHGVILQAFQHERLHELPLTGGASTYRQSVPLSPELLDHATRILEAIGWTGVAMVEFKVDKSTGRHALMEINGRFWGSLPLSSRAAMRFAEDLYRMQVLGETPEQRRYGVGIRCRKLSADIDWFKEIIRLKRGEAASSGLVRLPGWSTIARETLQLFSPATRFDVQVLDDPWPGVRDVVDTVRVHLGGLGHRLSRSVGRTPWLNAYGARNRRRAFQRARSAHHILVLCYGNIIRSPFAGEYLRSRLRGGDRDVEIRTAGTFHFTGRRADGGAIDMARAWGVDLEDHRSSTVSQGLVDWADLILVMDRANLRSLTSTYAAAAEKTFLLGVFGPRGQAGIEIPDPYRLGSRQLHASFTTIAASVDRLVMTRKTPRAPTIVSPAAFLPSREG